MIQALLLKKITLGTNTVLHFFLCQVMFADKGKNDAIVANTILTRSLIFDHVICKISMHILENSRCSTFISILMLRHGSVECRLLFGSNLDRQSSIEG